LWRVTGTCPQCKQEFEVANHAAERQEPKITVEDEITLKLRRERRSQRRLKAASNSPPDIRAQREEEAKKQSELDLGHKRHKKPGRGVLSINLLFATSVLLSGLRHSALDDLWRCSGLNIIPSRSLDRYSPLVWAAAVSAAKKIMNRRLMDITRKFGKDGLQLAMDGSWSHTRDANHHCFVVLDAVDHKPLVISPLSKPRWGVDGATQQPVLRRPGNYDGFHSNGMEAVAWQKVAEAMDATGSYGLRDQVSLICCDQDALATAGQTVLPEGRGCSRRRSLF
jgi:hypothetical protein